MRLIGFKAQVVVVKRFLPDEKRLYIESRELKQGSQSYGNTRLTLAQMDATTGQNFPMTRQTNIGNGNLDCDFHDDSGVH